MSRRRRVLKLGLVCLGLLVMVAAIGAWRIFRVDDLPEQLETMERSPDDVVIPSVLDGPALRLADLRGKTVFLVVVSPQNKGKEGQALNRALNRWRFPDTTAGYIVADAAGLGFIPDGYVRKFVEFFAHESRFPIYVDFEGVVLDTFKLVKGHHGFVVLGPDGAVKLRESGGLEGAQLEELRQMLGAQEPPPPPDAPPDFDVAGLGPEDCKPRACAFVFLGEAVRREQIPGVEDGFDGEREEAFALLRRPHVRLAATAMKMDLRGAPGVLVGQTEGLREVAERGWTTVPDDADARETFGIGDDETAMVIVDARGRLAFREVGFIPMYAWGTAADLLGAEIMPEDDD